MLIRTCSPFRFDFASTEYPQRLAPHCSIRTLPSFSSVSHTPSGELAAWTGAAGGDGATGGTAATTGGGAGLGTGAASCWIGGAGGLGAGWGKGIRWWCRRRGRGRWRGRSGRRSRRGNGRRSRGLFGRCRTSRRRLRIDLGLLRCLLARTVLVAPRALRFPPAVVVDARDRNRSAIRIAANGVPTIFEGVLGLRCGARQHKRGNDKKPLHDLHSHPLSRRNSGP